MRSFRLKVASVLMVALLLSVSVFDTQVVKSELNQKFMDFLENETDFYESTPKRIATKQELDGVRIFYESGIENSEIYIDESTLYEAAHKTLVDHFNPCVVSCDVNDLEGFPDLYW